MKGSFQTTAAVLASLLLVDYLGGTAPAVAEPSVAPVLDPAGPLPGTVTVSHAQLEGLASDDAGELVLLTGDRDQDGLAAHLYATTRAADGTWGAPVELAAGHGSTQIAQIALAPDGSGVVSWNSYPSKYDVPDEVWARQRHADGTWGPAQLLAHGENVYGPLQSVAVAGGNAAVAYLDDDYQGVVASPTVSGWSTTHLPKDFGGPTIEMDDAGGLHAMVQSIPRGGGGN